ncbi:MAG: 16S rRNA (cytidine(1402)-2'-O)-methyltransferase [Defluviitaleaceae bacterium]|nr:16S rRNA (cytidine(1402)-2'-O)-methyltransferase [Defluviitaleaceae bacterium]
MSLYVVATPLGNLEDITARAIRVLGEVDIIAAEDTRHSRILLAHFDIKKPVFSCHKFNEGKRGDFFVSAMLEGKSVALISDAGTPCISDPGSLLVKAAAEAGITVIPVCGANAVAAAVSVSGFDASRFIFVGFLPRGKSAVAALSNALSASPVAVFYESPRRIIGVLELIAQNFPTAQICLCNDISKKFERIYRGTPAEILAELSQNPSAEKGEYTCVLHGEPIAQESEPDDTFSLEARLADIMVKKDCTLKEAAADLFAKEKIPKKEIYAATLRLKNLL